ncbi:MAG: nucleoside kinase [bacterium]|nr:nucleoside kinase [bacterium]MCM1375847.1 nucleoside kinase [Muribaculum sp.]
MKVEIMGEVKDYPQGITYEQIAADYQERFEGLIALASADGKLRELFKHVNRDCKIRFFTLKDSVGHKAYVRSASMLCLKAIHDTMGEQAVAACRIEFSVGNGIYISTGGAFDATVGNAEWIKGRMDELRVMAMPFHKKSLPLEEAVDLFRGKGMTDKTELFRYRRSSFVNVYEMDGYFDYYYGFMLPNAGYVEWYDLQAYEDGLMLVLPNQKEPTVVRPLTQRRKLFKTLLASAQWGHEVGIENVGELNNQICSGSISDMILVQEAEQERKIGEIAREICGRRGVKFVMIAGPSSSGKTSFSHRLSIQLRTLGMTPHPVALDNYFVNREDTPLDENGDYNFECLEAIDVKKFNDDMVKLLAGERVEIPEFNFKIGRREYNGNYMQLGKEDVLVIEGIHGLNPKMSYALPNESKFKIYISALTNLNVDAHNRIPTTDGRLLRRMVRDARTRGASAQRTIQMWPSVRRGEEEYIFPFQEEADVMFNSATVYELAALKQYAEPLLFHIEKDQPEYYEAKRLLKFLEYFLGISSEELPRNSICREFVGGSCFRV